MFCRLINRVYVKADRIALIGSADGFSERKDRTNLSITIDSRCVSHAPFVDRVTLTRICSLTIRFSIVFCRLLSVAMVDALISERYRLFFESVRVRSVLPSSMTPCESTRRGVDIFQRCAIFARRDR